MYCQRRGGGFWSLLGKTVTGICSDAGGGDSPPAGIAGTPRTQRTVRQVRSLPIHRLSGAGRAVPFPADSATPRVPATPVLVSGALRSLKPDPRRWMAAEPASSWKTPGPSPSAAWWDTSGPFGQGPPRSPTGPGRSPGTADPAAGVMLRLGLVAGNQCR